MLKTKYLQMTVESILFPDNAYFSFDQKRKIKRVGISRPVIRDDEIDGICLSSFITLFSLSSFDDSLFNRPSYRVDLDIENGSILSMYDLSIEGEFSSAPYSRKYDLSSGMPAKWQSEKFYEDTYNLLDEIRKEYIQTKMINKRKYKLYMKHIVSQCPISYRRFFRELSI